jgi:hypothetical protein
MATANSHCTDKQIDMIWDEAKRTLLRLREEYKQGMEKTQKDKEQLSNLLQEWMDDPEAANKKYGKKSSG